MHKDPVEYLRHILDECKFILSINAKNLTKNQFLDDEILKRASVRSLEIICEATKNISADFKVKWNSISWREIARMRDRLIHDYMGVNYSIVWDVMKNKIPELEIQIQKIIEELHLK